MYDLTKFTLKSMTECGAELRKLGFGANSMEEVSNCIVRYLYEKFIDERTNQRAFALVRFFKTHSYEELETSLQQVVDRAIATSPAVSWERSSLGQLKCLTLLATAGEQPQWDSRQASEGHQVIPLTSEQIVAQSPMISQLLKQFGLEISSVLSPEPDLLVDLEQKTFNVFHVPKAIASPYVPAQQEFVIPHGIQSVLGFGGMLPSGNIIAVILFSKVVISRHTADMFKTLALNAKIAILPFDGGIIFSK
jgi:hypothetical protein